MATFCLIGTTTPNFGAVMNEVDRVRRNIVKLRLKKGWTQERLAFESDVSKAGLCDIESGKRNPTVKTLEKLATALEVSLSKLVS